MEADEGRTAVQLMTEAHRYRTKKQMHALCNGGLLVLPHTKALQQSGAHASLHPRVLIRAQEVPVRPHPQRSSDWFDAAARCNQAEGVAKR
eukprot:1146053-Pelagomonas_calceolata.AAC.1